MVHCSVLKFLLNKSANLRTKNSISDCIFGSEKIKTDLYFGLSIPNKNGTITNEEWAKFVEKMIVPQFKKGLTVIKAEGHWNGGDSIVTEPTRIVEFIYSKLKSVDASKKLELIRNEYKTQFNQQSVLRIDQNVCISF